MSIDKNKLTNDNIDKMKVGFCIELNCLNDNFVNDIENLKEFISNSEFLLVNQNLYTLIRNFDCLSELICHNIQVILNDVDKNEVYCSYSTRYL